MKSRNVRVAEALLAAAMLAAVCACAPSAGTGESQTAQAATNADLIVTGATVITMDADRRVLDPGAVAIRDGRIVAVGPADEIAATWSAPTTVEARPRDILAPGLINGHTHAAMTLLRGVADDMALMDWLQNYIFPAEAQTVDAEFVRVGTTLGAMEMIRTGTTTFVDGYYFEDVVGEVVDAVGLRGVLGETVIGFPAPDNATPADSLQYTERFMQRWEGHPRVTATVFPHSPYTVSPEDLQASAALARQYRRPLLIHLAETRDEVDTIRERYGLTPTGHLERIGFLGPDVVGAHGIWVDDADIELLGQRGVGLVHNPESNMKLASGTMPVPELLAAGIPVGLGPDGAASNNDLDMFGAMQEEALLQKHARQAPAALPAWRAVEMATIGGARALHMQDEIGSIEVGKRADLVLVDGDAPNMVPRYDPYSHLVYTAQGDNVRLTVVEGRILYRDGAYTSLDPARVIADARRLADRVREAVDRD